MIYVYRGILLMKNACALNYERYLNTQFESDKIALKALLLFIHYSLGLEARRGHFK
jgi:hypothetical protein